MTDTIRRSIGMGILSAIAVLGLLVPVTHASVACTTTDECVAALRLGSECVDNKCTNPYHLGGCLQQRIPDWKKTRVCHSEDPPEAMEKGYCVAPDPNFDYPEIRILAQNWESAFFQAWVIQIVLSEILGIPVTLETGNKEDEVEFYNAGSHLDYGVSYDYDALRRGNDVGDCRLIDNNTPDEEYQSCAHVLPEIWYGHETKVNMLLEEGVIRRPGLGGTLGYQGLYIPRFVGARDTSLLTYLGLTGEENRHKLAGTFKRPTSWKEYCELVSPVNCTEDDGIAQGYPSLDQEDRYHVEGSFKGHFRATEQNNCTLNPTACTGHIVDYPCGWTSFVKQQMHHLNIALESNGPQEVSHGYSYSQMTEIWVAANKTQENVMMRWWTPEALFQTFLGSDAEFTRVDLPPATQECIGARIDTQDRCNEETTEVLRLGEPKGTCDEPPFALKRLFTQWLVDNSNDPTLSEEVRSPGYQTIDNIQLDGLQIGEIFHNWLKQDSDKYNSDPRDATCKWVAENFVTIQSYLPPSYPRVIEDKEAKMDALDYVSIIFSCLAAACVGLSLVGVILNRKKSAMVLAQVNFLYLLLAGLAMVSTASMLLNVHPTDNSCMAISWLVSLGYTFELIPLVFKVAAIASLISASRKFKRVRLDKTKLFSAVFVVAAAVVIFLVIWTVLDPVEQRAEFNLTNDVNEEGDTIVSRSYYCSSDSGAWLYVVVGWQALLLFCGAILAVTTRKMRKDMTESLVVSVLVYSHCMFVVLRLLQFQFAERLDASNLARYSSLIFSGDVIAACCIYFFPKIILEEDKVTRNPIVPPVLLPPQSVRHVIQKVTRNLPRLDSGIHHLTDVSEEDEDGDDSTLFDHTSRTFTFHDSFGSASQRGLTRNHSLPALGGIPKRSRKNLRDSLVANDGSNRSLRFDSLMTASGNAIPTGMLDSFEWDNMRLNSESAKRSARSLGSHPAAMSAISLDTACTTIAEEDSAAYEDSSIFDLDEIVDRRLSLADSSNRGRSLPVLPIRQEDETEDWEKMTTISC